MEGAHFSSHPFVSIIVRLPGCFSEIITITKRAVRNAVHFPPTRSALLKLKLISIFRVQKASLDGFVNFMSW